MKTFSRLLVLLVTSSGLFASGVLKSLPMDLPRTISVLQSDLSQQIEAVSGLLDRILPEYSHLFELRALPDCDSIQSACFEVHTDGKRIFVKGASGMAHFTSSKVCLLYACNVTPLHATTRPSCQPFPYSCVQLNANGAPATGGQVPAFVTDQKLA